MEAEAWDQQFAEQKLIPWTVLGSPTAVIP